MKWFHFHKTQKYLIKIDKRCTKCGYCVKICPLIFRWAADSEKGQPLSVRSSVVRRCLIRCEAGCPAGAIQVADVEEE